MVGSKKSFKGYLYLLPALILLAIFTVWPLINTTRLAFLNGYKMMDQLGGQTYSLGVQNFVTVFTNTYFRKLFFTALRNTAVLCIITVPVSTLIALVVSVCLNSIGRVGKVLQSIYFLPYVTNAIAIGMVFNMMFNVVGISLATDNPSIVTPGIVNTILGYLGLEKPINWIAGGSTVLANYTVLCTYIIWNALPFKILIILGGLQSVNKNYYDAAKIDGASKWTTFWKITVPMLSPIIAYVVITGFIGAFKEYNSVVGIFSETEAQTGQMVTIVGIIMDKLGDSEGIAAAVALILFGIILIITLFQLWVQKKTVHY